MNGDKPLCVCRQGFQAVVVDARGFGRLEQKNKFSVGAIIEVMKPDGRNIETTVRGIYDEAGNARESAPHAKQIVYADLGAELQPYDILRRRDG